MEIGNRIASQSNSAVIDRTLDFWDLVPPGLPMMWTKPLNQIPYDKGFQLADGTNGTPNLMGRFLKTIPNTATNPGGTGGSNTKTIAAANMPAHGHPFTGVPHVHAGPSHAHSWSGTSSTAANHNHPLVAGLTSNIGGGEKVPWFGNGNQAARTDGVICVTTVQQNMWAYEFKPWFTLRNKEGGSHAHTVSGNTSASGTGNTGSVTAGGSVGNTGGGAALDIQPAFYEIAIIIKIAA